MHAIGVSIHKNGLSGAELVAYGLMSNKLTTAISRNVSTNAWRDSLALAISAVGQQSGEDAVNAVNKVFGDVAKALRSSALLKALDDGGYGGLSQIVKVEDGKEAIPTRVERKLGHLYGSKFKLERQVDAALKTAENYRTRIVNAVRAGVDLDVSMTQRQLDEARIKAETEALPEDEREALKAKREGAKNAAAMADAFRKAILGTENPSLLLLAELLTTAVVSFEYGDAVLQDGFVEAMGPWADKFDEARKAAQEQGQPQDKTTEGASENDESEDVSLSDAVPAQAVAA